LLLKDGLPSLPDQDSASGMNHPSTGNNRSAHDNNSSFNSSHCVRLLRFSNSLNQDSASFLTCECDYALSCSTCSENKILKYMELNVLHNTFLENDSGHVPVIQQYITRVLKLIVLTTTVTEACVSFENVMLNIGSISFDIFVKIPLDDDEMYALVSTLCHNQDTTYLEPIELYQITSDCYQCVWKYTYDLEPKDQHLMIGQYHTSGNGKSSPLTQQSKTFLEYYKLHWYLSDNRFIWYHEPEWIYILRLLLISGMETEKSSSFQQLTCGKCKKKYKSSCMAHYVT
jgi:hypothetical protein